MTRLADVITCLLATISIADALQIFLPDVPSSEAHERHGFLSVAGVVLDDGVVLPAERHGSLQTSLAMVWAHGHFPGDPTASDHTNDSTFKPVLASLERADVTGIFYTARGFGQSTGWQNISGHRRLDQFKWSSLSLDMMAVADAFALDAFIAGGVSMGAHTALMSAVHSPDRVRGLVLIRPAAAYEDRVGSRRRSCAHAWERRAATQVGLGNSAYIVHLAAARDDLPPAEEISGKVTCPVLLLAVKDDACHPVTTSKRLQAILETSTTVQFHAYDSRAHLEDFAPAIVAAFLDGLKQS